MADDIPKEPIGKALIYGRNDDATYTVVRVSDDRMSLYSVSSMMNQVIGIGCEKTDPILFYIYNERVDGRDLAKLVRQYRQREIEEIIVEITPDREAVGRALMDFYFRFAGHLEHHMKLGGHITMGEQEIMSNNLDSLLRD